MIRNGLSAEALPPCGEQALTTPAAAVAAVPAASLLKERLLNSRLLVDIVVLVSVEGVSMGPGGCLRLPDHWSNW
ncbi:MULTISPECIES: hypothetical protein [Streptomyces]|uniref:Uncharacterized protein n=1 Tax=Streptomyces lienomycini TaxID=284035 RepID=A0ABV9WPN6_9ACTN|nr:MULTISPECIES: hypothetical protein [Streptomyces]